MNPDTPSLLPTPRTDALTKKFDTSNYMIHANGVIMDEIMALAEHARQLERELASRPAELASGVVVPPEEPYFVEVDNNGCSHCGAQRSWNVIGPDGVALGISYGEEEVAADLAEQLNTAFDAGLKFASRPSLPVDRWIPVSERLPRLTDCVKYDGVHCVAVLWDGINPGCCAFDHNRAGGLPPGVTHWMPLPQPPLEGTDQNARSTTDVSGGTDHKQSGEHAVDRNAVIESRPDLVGRLEEKLRGMIVKMEFETNRVPLEIKGFNEGIKAAIEAALALSKGKEG